MYQNFYQNKSQYQRSISGSPYKKYIESYQFDYELISEVDADVVSYDDFKAYARSDGNVGIIDCGDVS